MSVIASTCVCVCVCVCVYACHVASFTGLSPALFNCMEKTWENELMISLRAMM